VFYKGIVMETLIDIEETEKILRYIQYRIAQKFSAGENVLSLLPSADVATCLHILEQIDAPASRQYLYH
jgi:hydrogenase maturation factor HypF (carbamoyltransferase family)